MILANECKYARPTKIKIVLYSHLIIDRTYVVCHFSICHISLFF